MTTLTTQGSFVNTTDATFRDWVARAISMLTTVGLVRTSDTGQVDTATVLKPTAASTVAGYAMFRLSDAAQATKPIFVRIDFGSGSSVTSPGMRVILSKGTDGAGTPTGVLYTGRLAVVGGGSSTVVDWRAIATPGYFALLPSVAPQGGGGMSPGSPFFLVERSPDGTSVMVVDQQVNNHGLTTSSTITPMCSVITYESTATTSGMVPVVLPYKIAGANLTSGTPLAAASLGPVFPWVLFPPSQAPWQSCLGLSYPGGDAPGAQFQATLEGQDRTYLPIPLSDGYSAFGLGMSHQSEYSRHVGLAVRWE